MECVFCREDGGELWKDDALRVILADEADWPGFCRVVWNAHVAEMSDLTDDDRARYDGGEHCRTRDAPRPCAGQD